MTTVPVDTVVRVASGIVFILGVFSLVLTITTGFDVMNPLIALLMLIVSISFPAMTKLKRGYKNPG